MESLQLLQKSETQNNNTEQNIVHHTKYLPYFIIIQKPGNKEVKIPCANETIAKKVLAGLTRLKTVS